MLKSLKWFRVRVTDIQTGKSITDVKFPASLASFGMKMAAKYAPESIEGLDINQMINSMDADSNGILVDVEDADKGEHVEIFIE